MTEKENKLRWPCPRVSVALGKNQELVPFTSFHLSFVSPVDCEFLINVDTFSASDLVAPDSSKRKIIDFFQNFFICWN